MMMQNHNDEAFAAPELSLVVPMYNEASNIKEFFRVVNQILLKIGMTYEIICVNDGSKDETLAILLGLSLHDKRIKIIDLSRNFGKESALTAGLDATRGRAVIPIDADLQEPPELLPQMVSLWKEGNDVVLAKRSDRRSDSLLKRWCAESYYSIIRHLSDTPIPENVGDFRLMDRRVVEALRALPERTRFMKGLFAWLGFKQTEIQFVRPARYAGDTSQSPIKLIRLALDGLISFTTLPLRIWTYVGLLLAASSLGYMIYTLFKTAIYGDQVAGFPTLATGLFFFNGMIMINLGVLGEYVSRIFNEVKARPVYLVRERINFDE